MKYLEREGSIKDMIGYAYQDFDTDKRYLILRGGNDITSGSRFEFIEPKIEFGYKPLVEALNRAIDEEEKHNGASAVSVEKATYVPETEYNYEELMTEFQELVGTLMAKDQAYYAPRITQVVERYLGRGKKISEATLDQAELVFYVVKEIKETLLGKKK